MFLRDVENEPSETTHTGRQIARLKKRGVEIPQLLQIFACKPAMSKALGELSEQIMRGPSPLEPGLRELIAAFTSDRNGCVF